MITEPEDIDIPGYLRHETVNDYAYVIGMDEAGLLEEREDYTGLDEFEEIYEEFLDGIDNKGIIDQVLVNRMQEYKDNFPGEIGERVYRIAEVSRAVKELDEYIRKGDFEPVTVGETLKLIEKEGCVDYSGRRDEQVYGNHALELVPSTLLKNWRFHARGVEYPQIWAEVSEGGETYDIEIWDNGPGLDPEDLSRTGMGFDIVDTVSDLFDAEFEIDPAVAEEHGESGASYRWTVKKY